MERSVRENCSANKQKSANRKDFHVPANSLPNDDNNWRIPSKA